MEGGGPVIDWAALAPHIEHQTREAIVEALRWCGPLSAPDLKGVLDDPDIPLACIAYHVRTLARKGLLRSVGGREPGASVETLYCFPVR